MKIKLLIAIFSKFEFSIFISLLFALIIDNILVSSVKLSTKSFFDENFPINGTALVEKGIDFLNTGILIKITCVFLFFFLYFPATLELVWRNISTSGQWRVSRRDVCHFWVKSIKCCCASFTRLLYSWEGHGFQMAWLQEGGGPAAHIRHHLRTRCEPLRF